MLDFTSRGFLPLGARRERYGKHARRVKLRPPAERIWLMLMAISFADQNASGLKNWPAPRCARVLQGRCPHRRRFRPGIAATTFTPKTIRAVARGKRRPACRGSYKVPSYLARGVMAFRMLARGARSSKVTVFPCRRMPNCCQSVSSSTVTGWEAISS